LERGSTLILGNGEHIEIRLSSMGEGDTTATFAVAGDMPTF
jgi:hypothetical protein